MSSDCSPRLTVADIIAVDPSIRVLVGPIHATLDGAEVTSASPGIWIWSASNRFAPKLFHTSTLEDGIDAAHAFAQAFHAATLRSSDEQEGGIIIPDYMY